MMSLAREHNKSAPAATTRFSNHQEGVNLLLDKTAANQHAFQESMQNLQLTMQNQLGRVLSITTQNTGDIHGLQLSHQKMDLRQTRTEEDVTELRETVERLKVGGNQVGHRDLEEEKTQLFEGEDKELPVNGELSMDYSILCVVAYYIRPYLTCHLLLCFSISLSP